MNVGLLTVMLAIGQTDGLNPEAGPVASQMPKALVDVGVTQMLNDLIPLDIGFRDETGKAVELREYFRDKPVILVLVQYRCPQLCGIVLNNLVDGLRGVSLSAGDGYELVVVSFDPREEPELAAAKKAAYLEKYARPGAEAHWHFLTGQQPAIDRLATAVGFRYRYEAANDRYAHPSAVTLLTPQGRVSRYLFDTGFSARDLRLAMVEASQGHVGSVVDQMLLYCYHYDPVSGSYAAYAMGLMRLGGAVTVIVMATVLIRVWRRENRLAGPAVSPQG